MKNTLKRIGALAVGGALAIAASTAFAGSKFNGDGHVIVARNADGSGSASGYLGMIYNGTFLVEYIGCQKSATGAVFCHARSETDVRLTCSTTSAFLAQSIASLSPDVRLTFRVAANGACTSITVVHSSEYQDKQG
jgi:hypothetical protein